MRWHLRNHNCKHILLGISHDAGYAPFLDEIVTPDDKRRITILEGPPTVQELARTGIQIINFDHIFRAEKLTPNTRAITSTASQNTWAGVTSIIPPPTVASPPIPKTSPAIRKASAVSTKPTWEPSPRGLDDPLVVDPAVLERLRRRPANNKLCNNHYLRGPCAKDECGFEHDHKPSAAELVAVSYLTRLNPCTNGQDCYDDYCIYGHHCPSVVFSSNGKDPICNAYNCRYTKEDHPPNTVIKQPRKQNGY